MIIGKSQYSIVSKASHHPLTRRSLLLCCLVLIVAKSLFGQRLQVKNLQCEYLTDPLGVSAMTPKLSWNLVSSERAVMQTAYRVIVADNPDSLQKGNGNIWDSRKVISDASIQVIYKGKQLVSGKKYYWKVMVWDNQQSFSAWSYNAIWQMGLLSPPDWKGASWISYEKMPDSLLLSPRNAEAKRVAIKDTLPIFRRDFFVRHDLKMATAFIAGLGHFELSTNGKKTGDHFLDAGWTDYNKHALYVTFDITKQLQKGNNTVGVMLGNGFYFIPGGRYTKLQVAYGFPKMICRIVLEYADGTIDNIISDTSWKTSAGPITFSSMYGGEDYDARLVQRGWAAPGFDDRSWKNALTVDGPLLLDAQTASPLKIFDHFTVKKITNPKPGIWVYDLGQNASGIPFIRVKGKKGTRVRLWPSELLAKDGIITTNSIGSPVYFDYVLKGDSIESWHPQFTYHGFRYIQVEGGVPSGGQNPDHLPEIITLEGLHTRNAATTVGHFSSSGTLFNKIDTLINWGIKSNMASVFTDCPHREKLGWLEQVHLMGSSIKYNYDIASLARKVIRDMIISQTAEGLVPDIAPEYAQFGGGFRDSPEWGSNSIILPWYMFQWYGDKQLLEEAYPMMQRYAGYLQTKTRDGIIAYGLGDWYDIGPKPPGSSQLTPKGVTATTIYYHDLTILYKTAILLNKQADAAFYKKLSEQVKGAYNNTFFNKETKQYATGSQTANAMSVYMELVDARDKEAVINNIVADIRAHNNGLTAGDIGYRYLLRVLDDNNRSGVIYDMNSNPLVPGYGYQLSRGATALTESWQAFDDASNNHMMLGHLMEWFYAGLAGIRQAEREVAWKEIEIRPQVVGSITSAKATYQSPYGLISSKWKKSGQSFDLRVSIPVNTHAVVYLPAAKSSHVTESTKQIIEVGKIKIIQQNESHFAVRIGSGDYHFKVK